MSSCGVRLAALSVCTGCFLAKGCFLVAATVKAYIGCLLGRVCFIERFLNLSSKGVLELLLNLRPFPPSWLILVLLLLLLLSKTN